MCGGAVKKALNDVFAPFRMVKDAIMPTPEISSGGGGGGGSELGSNRPIAPEEKSGALDEGEMTARKRKKMGKAALMIQQDLGGTSGKTGLGIPV